MDRRQLLICIFATITLVATTWLYGGHSPLTLCISLAGTAFTFLWLFLPTFEFGSSQNAKENVWRLIKFPLFWIGLLLFAYICVQWARPNYEMIRGLKAWYIFETQGEAPSMAFPTSIRAPFGFEYNACTSPLRQLCILGNAWLMLCTLWCGVRSRKALKWMTLIFIGNALLTAAFGFYQQIAGTSYYLGARTFHWGPFFYTNHAAEFFALNIALCVGIALRSWRETTLSFGRGGLHLPLVIVVLAFIVAAIATRSIGGSFIAIAWIPIGLALILFSNLLDKKSWILFGFFMISLGALGAFWYSNANLDSYSKKIDRKIATAEIPDLKRNANEENERSFFTFGQGDRKKLRDLSQKIFEYNPQTGDWWTDHHTQIYGWGAGSYRWISPSFQKTIPEMSYLNKRTGKRDIHAYANYAHCDIWNMLVEWGIAGTAIFGAGTLWFFGWAFYNCRRWRVSSLAYLGGIGLFMIHGYFDFMIYSPFLTLTIALLMVNFKVDLSRERLLNHE